MNNDIGIMLNNIKNAEVVSPVPNVNIGKGTPVFTKNDVFKTNNMFGRLARAIFVKENITINELGFRQRELYSKMEMKYTSTDRTNLLSALCRHDVTFKKFFEAIVNILGYQIDITIKLTKDGISNSYTYSDIIDEMNATREEQ